MQNSLFKLFEHKCVLEVCVHIHPIMIKIHPVFFYLFFYKTPFLKSGCFEIPVRMTKFWAGRSHDSWLTRPSYLRPALSELWVSCPPPVQGKTGCLRLSNWGALLLDAITNIAVVIYSRHLSCWIRRRLTLLSFWRECASRALGLCLNASIFT